jgi:hypothetical protein
MDSNQLAPCNSTKAPDATVHCGDSLIKHKGKKGRGCKQVNFVQFMQYQHFILFYCKIL